MTTPMISVITVVKNDLPGLRLTAQLVLEQTSGEFEWLIIDGNSSDGSSAYLQRLEEHGLARVLSESDSGIYDAMNKGIDLAEGQHAIFLNAGDSFYSAEVLSLLTSALQAINPALRTHTIVYGSYALRFQDGTTIRRNTRKPTHIWYGLPTSHQAMVFPLDFLRLHKYDLRYKICGDYYIVATSYKFGLEFVTLDFPVATFMVGGSSFKKPFRLLRESLSIQHRVLNVPFPLLAYSAARKSISALGIRALNTIHTRKHRKP